MSSSGEKDKAIIGKLVLDLSKFFDNAEGKLIEYTLNSKALKKKHPVCALSPFYPL